MTAIIQLAKYAKNESEDRPRHSWQVISREVNKSR